jgi:hypothetical protein
MPYAVVVEKTTSNGTSAIVLGLDIQHVHNDPVQLMNEVERRGFRLFSVQQQGEYTRYTFATPGTCMLVLTCCAYIVRICYRRHKRPACFLRAQRLGAQAQSGSCGGSSSPRCPGCCSTHCYRPHRCHYCCDTASYGRTRQGDFLERFRRPVRAAFVSN